MRQLFKLFYMLSRFLISFFCHSNSASLVSGEEGKDEKMDTSSPAEEKKGAYMSKHTQTGTHLAMKVNFILYFLKMPIKTFDSDRDILNRFIR